MCHLHIFDEIDGLRSIFNRSFIFLFLLACLLLLMPLFFGLNQLVVFIRHRWFGFYSFIYYMCLLRKESLIYRELCDSENAFLKWVKCMAFSWGVHATEISTQITFHHLFSISASIPHVSLWGFVSTATEKIEMVDFKIHLLFFFILILTPNFETN